MVKWGKCWQILSSFRMLFIFALICIIQDKPNERPGWGLKLYKLKFCILDQYTWYAKRRAWSKTKKCNFQQSIQEKGTKKKDL